MNKPEFFALVAEVLEVEPDGLSGSDIIADVGTWDSLAVISFVAMVDREFDIHVSLDSAAAQRICEFLRRFGDQRVAVIGQPIGERLERRVFLGFQHGRIIVGANDVSLLAEEFQQVAIVDVEAKVARSRVEICPVYKQTHTFCWQEMHTIAFQYTLGWPSLRQGGPFLNA